MRSVLLPLLLLAGCPSDSSVDDATTGGQSGGITWGACEGTTSGKEMDSVWEDDGEIFVYADQQDNLILFHLLNLPANCCPDPEVVDTLNGTTLRVDFEDVRATGVPCRCSCILDFEVALDGYSPPTSGYAYEVWYDGEKIGEGTTIEVF